LSGQGLCSGWLPEAWAVFVLSCSCCADAQAVKANGTARALQNLIVEPFAQLHNGLGLVRAAPASSCLPASQATLPVPMLQATPGAVAPYSCRSGLSQLMVVVGAAHQNRQAVPMRMIMKRRQTLDCAYHICNLQKVTQAQVSCLLKAVE
jgi:hypothetical protein